MSRTLLGFLLLCALIPCLASPCVPSDQPGQPSCPSRTPAAPHEKDPSRGDDNAPLVIRDIRFELERGVKERVLVLSSRFFKPWVSALEGERPRFVIDIRNTDSVRGGLKNIPVDGLFIKRIRTHHDRQSGTLRIVLDLSPDENYSVNHTFFEAENLYVIDIEPERKEEGG